MRKLALICTLIWVVLSLNAQVCTRVYKEQVRTLRVVRACDVDDAGQLRAVRPFLVLADEAIDGSEPENTLHVSFDEMSHDVHFYTYSVKHMSADWSRESELVSGEYLRGFTTHDITEYEHSLNTTREYTHYEFLFPNEDMVLTKSGNYLLTIYEDGNPENRVAEVQFCVAEPLAKIETDVRSHTDIELNGRYQQLDINVATVALNLKDPNEVKVLVRQNNRTDNQVWLGFPTFVENNRLRYMNNKSLIFEAGNEYHHFDAFSAYYAGTGIDRVVFEGGDYQALLFRDEVATGQYIHQFDSDGRFLVNAERTRDCDTEAEYMWVYWTLAAENPWFDGAVYVGGDLFGNELNLRNRMQYDAETKCYWLTSLVKQGGYDYLYWFVPKQPTTNDQRLTTNTKTTTQRVDGSYWQTENEYTVYVYWRPFGARYDRLAGMSVIKSQL